MSRLSKAQFDDLLDNVIGVTKRNGWKGSKQQFNCPIHHESNPSCGVNLDFSPEPGNHYQVFNCFSCGASGTIPWLLFRSLPDQFRNLKSAEEFLKERYGVSYTYSFEDGKIVDIKRYGEVEEEKPRESFPVSKLAVMKSGKETYQYFFDRGFNKEDMVRFKIGRDLKSKTVTIPLFWEDNTLAGMIGRYIDNKRPKNMRYKIYWNFHKGGMIYPLNDYKVSFDTLIVVESMFDVIMMKKWGYDNVVSIMGNIMSREQANIIGGQCRQVIALFDNDEGGERAKVIASQLLKGSSRALFCLTPTYYPDFGKDPSEWGKEETDKILSNLSLISNVPRIV